MTDRHHLRWRWLAAGAAAVLVTIVLFWFQPHKLFVDDRVDEAIPVVTAEPVPTSVPAVSDAEAPHDVRGRDRVDRSGVVDLVPANNFLQEPCSNE